MSNKTNKESQSTTNNIEIPDWQSISNDPNVMVGNDWKTFLLKFEEKHTGFFKKMKILYPQLK